MLNWLLKSIGLSDDFVIHIENAKLGFHEPMALWIGLPLLIPAAYFIYSRQKHNLLTVRFTPRLILTTIRVLILALLVIVLAGPYLKLDQHREKKPIVAVLFDHSQSMQLEVGMFEPESELVKMVEAAGYQVIDGQLSDQQRKDFPKTARAKLVHDVVGHHTEKLLTTLAKKYEVQFYSFADDTLPIEVVAGKFQLPEPPKPRSKWGVQTKLGDAVEHVLREAAGRQVAGIIIFSDGQNTAGISLPEAARVAASAETPIFTVPAGASKREKDVAIVEVFTTGLVAAGDTARVTVKIESHGLDNRPPVKVQLIEDDKVLDSKDLVLKSAEQQQVELTYQAKKPGSHYLKVRIPPLNEEPKYLHANNEDAAFIRVSEGKLRVLYLEGLPRWDFRFLKNAMRRDPGLGGRKAKEKKATPPEIVLEAEWRRLPATRQAEMLPKTLDELADYHTVILGDVSPTLLSPDFLNLLVKAVREKGLGLVIEAGPLHMPHEFERRLLELLPVRLTRRQGDIVPGWVSHRQGRSFTLEMSPQGSIHEAMRFYDNPSQNKNAWAYMPPYFWCAAASRPSPAATVLAWNPNIKGRYGKAPLIAHQYAGKGRVMFVGTDSTWLWRQNVGDRYFYKFWGQAIRYVARRDPSTMKNSWLEVRPLRAQPGERASIELMAFKKDGSPRTDASISVHLFDGKTKKMVKLDADPGIKGHYTGNFLVEDIGQKDYRVTYPGGSGTGKAEGKLRVVPSLEELRHPHVDLEKLGQLAAPTHGDLVKLYDLARIPKELVRRKLTKKSLEAMRADEVPETVTARLERLTDKTFITEKHLVSELQATLGADEMERHKAKVITHAEVIDDQAQSSVLPNQKDIWDNWLVLSLLVFLYSLDVGMRRLAGLA